MEDFVMLLENKTRVTSPKGAKPAFSKYLAARKGERDMAKRGGAASKWARGDRQTDDLVSVFMILGPGTTAVNPSQTISRMTYQVKNLLM